MFRFLLPCLALLLVWMPAATIAQTQPPVPSQWPSADAPETDLAALDVRRLLLATAGALIGVSAIQSLSVNPATAGWMTWLSGRLLVVFGAFVGNRVFGGLYDFVGWLNGAETAGGV